MSENEHRLGNRYPELRRFASKEEAEAVLMSWRRRSFKTPAFWLGLLAITVIIGGSVFGIMIFVRQWVTFENSLYGGIVGGVTGGSGPLASAWLWRRRCRAFLRQELAVRGVPICVKCGYDLRGQTVARCPECGDNFDTRLLASNQCAETNDRPS